MVRVLAMMWNVLTSLWRALVDWLSNFDLLGWDGALWALLLLGVGLLVMLVRRGTRRLPASTRPELLISLGEVVPLESSRLTHLSLNVSNLGPNPLQILELAVQTELMPGPETVGVAALVPPHSAVEITTELEQLAGDEGTVDLYLYAPFSRHRSYRLRARLQWEPWRGAYRIAPLEQRLTPVRKLASTRLQKLQRDSWRRRHEDLADGEPLPPAVAPVEEEGIPAERERERQRERDPLDFPSDF